MTTTHGTLAAYLCLCALMATTAAAGEPVCGDVNDTGTVNTSDALLVLRKGVGQVVELDCNCTPTFETRFDASGATIIDNQTGLEWDKKDGEDGIPDLANLHDVDNAYRWTAGTEVGSIAADGPVFTDYIARLNGVSDGVCFEGHCDWRLPTRMELESLLDTACNGGPPCVVDPALLPTRNSPSWTSETVAGTPTVAWYVRFDSGNTNGNDKRLEQAARAVRNRF
jgi:hypothetical protein